MAKKQYMKRLSPKKKRFVEEVKVDYNPTRAARAAGYKNPSVMGNRLMKCPEVKSVINREQEQVRKRLALQQEDVLEQLHHLVTRKSGDYVDDKGQLKALNELGERAQNCIDGIEQEVYYERDRNGEVTGEVRKTKFKLNNKNASIDMAMKHLGAYAPEKKEIDLNGKITVDWGCLIGKPATPDPIEQRILEVQAVLPTLPVDPNYTLDEFEGDTND